MAEPITPDKQVDTTQNTFSSTEKVAETELFKENGATGSGSDEAGNTETTPHLHATTFLAVFAVLLIYFVQVFALVGAGAQGQTIAAYFHRPGESIWITAPIAILTVVLGPIVSQAADYWGRKWFLVILSLFGAVGSVVVARASSMAMVIAGVTIIGLAFAAQPLLHTVASEVLPRRWRGWAQSAVMISNALGLAAGLWIGGALNRNGNTDGFRNHFYISMALFAAAAIICVLVYRPPPTKLQATLSLNEKLSRLDWIGYLLLASSLVLFCLGLSWSQNPYEWSDPHVSATFAIGLALALGLILYEAKFKTDGMFHHGLFRGNRNFTIALICVFCEGIAFFAANLYFAFQVSVLYEADVLIVGVRFSITFIAVIFAALAAGLYCSITKTVRLATFVAFVLFAVFFICMATSNKGSSSAVWGYPVLLGWGLGITLITLVTVAQLSIPHELISIGSGLIISVRSLGGTIGIAIYNAVFIAGTRPMASNIAKAATAAGLPATSIEQFVPAIIGQNKTGLATIPGATPSIIGVGVDALLNTYVTGFRNVWASAIAFIVLAAIASLFLIDPRKEFNNHIDAPVEKDQDMYSS
ncbi:major facilitator superfamily domain-containing protein [Halenospora varia]|nr:major facilitator superfamily domain-containing protein [Halenospora varia]